MKKFPLGALLSTFGVGLLVATACGGSDPEDKSSSDKKNKQDDDEEDEGKKKKPSSKEGDKKGSELACLSDKQCAEQDQICDSELLVCVDCVSDADCGENASCEDRSCVEFTPCQSSKQCESSQVCDPYLERCVECVGDNDCGRGELCVDSQCKTSCVSDKTCSSLDQVCHSDFGVCVECESHSDCSEEERCSERNNCIPRVCGASAARCSEDGEELLSCNSSGSGFVREDCELGCVEDDGEARCRTEQEGGAGGSCAGWVSNVCSGIHPLPKKQKLDGKGDEFCSIPARRINLADGQKAAVKVAWSKDGFHMHVSVEDEDLRYVSTGDVYDSDNVQMYILPIPRDELPGGASAVISPAVGDLEEYGANQLAVSIPSEDFPAGQSRAYYNRSQFHTLMAYEAVSRTTAQGFDVEIFWAWPGALAESDEGEPLKLIQPKRGDKIQFNAQVGDINTGEEQKRDYRMYLNEATQDSLGCAWPLLYCNVVRWCESPLL